MTDLPVPKAEAKPSTKDLPKVPPGVYVAAGAAGIEAYETAVAAGHGAEAPTDWADAIVDVAFSAGVAFGRAQAAADIRDHPGPDPSPASPAWWAGYSEALRDAARIAEGSDGTRTDRDETTLPASTGGPDPRAETEDQ